MLPDYLQRQEVIPLHPQGVPKAVNVCGRELPIPRRRTTWLNEAFSLEEADLGNGDVRIRELIAQECEHRTDRESLVNRLLHLLVASARTNEVVESVLPDLDLVTLVEIDGVDSVSGKVSSELFEKGFFALIAAALGVAVYVWFRFEWQFGMGAIWALVHDITLTFGLFALTQMEFDLNIIAALLTIIGYSLNDTIVIYDRIRENLMKFRKMDLPALLDLSVNETLSRTVMTSLTILTPLVVLVLFGPDVIFGFSVAMAFGIFVGSYSSIYQSAPFLIWFGVNSDSFVPAEKVADSKVERLNEGKV